jgi:glucose/arabinose dehydrogenase
MNNEQSNRMQMTLRSHATCVLATIIVGSSILLTESRAQSQFADDYVPQPAYAWQTRAPLANQSPRLNVTTVTDGLVRPWSMAFLPDGNILVTEIPGRMRLVDSDGNISAPLDGLPPIRAYGSDGLQGLILDPAFEINRRIYFSYHAPFPGEPGNGTDEEYEEWTKRANEAGRGGPPLGIRYIASARLSDDQTAIEDVSVLLEAPGRRLLFAADGTLLITTMMGGGDQNTPQDPSLPYGKVMRINSDGSIPDDNPWSASDDVHSALFALGFRDPQGATIHPDTGELWVVENGPRGGDELNIVHPGRNYGWPTITYGRNYNKSPVGEGLTRKDGMEQPIYFWSPSIAPADMDFYTADLIPEWKGNLFIGALAGEHLTRLVLVGDRIVGEERLFVGFGDRIRQVRQGPDGALYLLIDHVSEGRMIRLTPQR